MAVSEILVGDCSTYLYWYTVLTTSVQVQYEYLYCTCTCTGMAWLRGCLLVLQKYLYNRPGIAAILSYEYGWPMARLPVLSTKYSYLNPYIEVQVTLLQVSCKCTSTGTVQVRNPLGTCTVLIRARVGHTVHTVKISVWLLAYEYLRQ